MRRRCSRACPPSKRICDERYRKKNPFWNDAMAEPALKLAPQPTADAQVPKTALLGRYRGRVRMILLVIVPLLAIVAGVAWYLAGGRYISTDNAYVGAQKVLITPDISGKVGRVLVREGEHVAIGAPLFEIDPVPFQLALRPAQSKLDSVGTDFSNLKSNYESLSRLVALGKETVELRQRDVDRKTALVANKTGTQVDLDNSTTALLTAELQLQLGQQ